MIAQKIEVGQKVNVQLTSEQCSKLGILKSPTGECTVKGFYPKGVYVTNAGRTIAIANKYNALSLVK